MGAVVSKQAKTQTRFCDNIFYHNDSSTCKLRKAKMRCNFIEFGLNIKNDYFFGTDKA